MADSGPAYRDRLCDIVTIPTLSENEAPWSSGSLNDVRYMGKADYTEALAIGKVD